MSDGRALLRAISDNPREDTPRLAYADWLDENGQPARAAMIRDHIAAYPELSEESVICGRDNFRMQARNATDPLLLLMQRVAAVTANPLLNGLNPFLQSLAADERLAWYRGFVEYVEVTYDELLDHAAEIFLEHPVTRVDLLGCEPWETDTGEFMWRRANDLEELYNSQAMLPGELFDPLIAEAIYVGQPDAKYYSERLAAMDALSVVSIAIGRAEAHRMANH